LVKIVLDKYCPNLEKYFGISSFNSGYFIPSGGNFSSFGYRALDFAMGKPNVLKYAAGSMKHNGLL